MLSYSAFSTTTNNYESSLVRKWLNESFYSTAFNESQKLKIQTTQVDNSATSTCMSPNPFASDNTSDKVYLLSYKDVINSHYGFSASIENEDLMKAAKTTELVRALGMAYNTSNQYYGNAAWMLRSPFHLNKDGISMISNKNKIIQYSDVQNEYGIRPAITIALA